METFILNILLGYLTNNIPTLRDLLQKDDDIEYQLSVCYNRALKKLIKNNDIRKRMSDRMFSKKEELIHYFKEGNKPACDELVNLWAKELMNDRKCISFINGLKVDKLLELDKNTNSLIQDIRDELEEIKKTLTNYTPLTRGLTIHNPVNGYIRRFCNLEKDEYDFVNYLSDNPNRYTLTDFITGCLDKTKNKLILYGNAQSGKTTELKNLCWELQESGFFYPVSYEVRSCYDLKVDQMPREHYINGKEVVVVIDALDEINGKDRDNLLLTINSYAHDNPKVKMVLSCRSNYRRDDMMNDFQEIYLQDMSGGDIIKHIQKKIGDYKLLWNLINENGLFYFAQNPFFLNILITTYQENKEIPKRRADIYQMFISNSYKSEKQKHTFDRFYKGCNPPLEILERLALAISLKSGQGLSLDEMNRCFNNDQQKIQECKRFNIVKYENDEFTFEENAFREWLVAFFLYKKGIEKVKTLATNENGKIKADWHNIIVLWLSMFTEEEETQIDEISKWLRIACKELIIYTEKDLLDEDFRYEIFKGIILEYKELGIRIRQQGSNIYQQLWDFGYSEQSVLFIIDELKAAHFNTSYYSDLMELCFYLNWKRLSLVYTKTYNDLLSVLEKDITDLTKTDNYTGLGFLFLENKFFTTKEFAKRFFPSFKDTENKHAVKAMIGLIHDANVSNEYVNYILDKEKLVHDYSEGGISHGVSRYIIYQALGKVDTKEGIKNILAHNFNDYYISQSYDNAYYCEMMDILLQRSADFILRGYIDLKEDVEDCFIRIFSHKHSGYNNLDFDRLILSFRDCFEKAHLVESAQKEFNQNALNLFKNTNATRGEFKKLSLKTGLWLTAEMLNQYYSTFRDKGLINECFAITFTQCPFKEVADLATIKKNEFFPEPEGILKHREKEIKFFSQFSDYGIFKNLVLNALNEIESDCTKDKRDFFWKKETTQDFNHYVSRFIYFFMNNKPFSKEEITQAINNKILYDSFFMRIVHECMNYEDQTDLIGDEEKRRCFITAKSLVKSMAHNRGTIRFEFEESAIKLMMTGAFKVDEDILVPLLPFSYLHISKPYNGDFSQSYSLFEYIEEHVVSQNKLSEKIIEMTQLENFWDDYRLCDLFVNYIIDHRVSKGYDLLLNRISSSPSNSLNIVESMLKAKIEVDTIKDLTEKMKGEDIVVVYRLIHSLLKDDKWVKKKLEAKLDTLQGNTHYEALRILLQLGSMKALSYVVNHLDIINDNREFYYNFMKKEAIKPLVTILQYRYDSKMDDHLVNNSIFESLSHIALQNKKNLDSVKDSFCDIISKNKDYKFLNRYLITFEDKYYEHIADIQDIDTIVKLLGSM